MRNAAETFITLKQREMGNDEKTRVLIHKTFTDDDPLFAVAFHPEKNQFALGFSSGLVQCYKYASCRILGQQKATDPSLLNLLWQTKRHKGSVRGLMYDLDGASLVSVGSDGVVKRAKPSSGKVVAKTKLEGDATPTVLKITESFVVIGDESGSVNALDVKTLEHKFYVPSIHEDVVTSIIDLQAHKEGKYRFLTAGDVKVAQVDLRKEEPKGLSDDQDDEILCGALVSPELSVFGMSEGVVTVWYNDNPEDQHNRIRLSDESIDSIVAAEDDDEFYAGSADGTVKLVHAKSGKTLKTWVHSRTQEASMLELDYEYRLVSAGMESLKIWALEDDVEEKPQLEGEDRNSEQLDSDDEDNKPKPKKRKGKKGKSNNKRPKHGIAAFSDL